MPQVCVSPGNLALPWLYEATQAQRCALAIADIKTCSSNDVAVVQVPKKADVNPRVVATTEASTAKCIDIAFSSGLATETAPAIISTMPKSVGNRAVR